MVDEEDHPDEVVVPQSEKPTPQINYPKSIPRQMQPPTRPLSRSHSAGNPMANQPRAPQTPANQQRPRPGPQNYQNQAASRPQQINQARPNVVSGAGSNMNNGGPHQTPPPQPAGQNAAVASSENVGFFSARAVKQIAGPKEEDVQNLPAAPLGAHAFNPHAESPSIRRTPGIDHSRTKPLSVDGKHAAPIIRPEIDDHDIPKTTTNGPLGAVKGGTSAPVSQQQQGPLSSQHGNIVNPQFNQARRIGAPIGPSSPLANRGQYRPPTMKRPALTEVNTNGTANSAAGGGGGAGGPLGGDPKRQKMT